MTVTRAEYRRRRLRDLRLVVVAFVLLAGANTMGFYLLGEQATANETSRKGVCALRHDLEERVANTTRILKDEKGKMVYGIPREVILNGLKNQKESLKALEIVDCE